VRPRAVHAQHHRAAALGDGQDAAGPLRPVPEQHRARLLCTVDLGRAALPHAESHQLQIGDGALGKVRRRKGGEAVRLALGQLEADDSGSARVPLQTQPVERGARVPSDAQAGLATMDDGLTQVRWVTGIHCRQVHANAWGGDVTELDRARAGDVECGGQGGPYLQVPDGYGRSLTSSGENDAMVSYERS